MDPFCFVGKMSFIVFQNFFGDRLFSSSIFRWYEDLAFRNWLLHWFLSLLYFSLSSSDLLFRNFLNCQSRSFIFDLVSASSQWHGRP
jgi:hypothetical protein